MKTAIQLSLFALLALASSANAQGTAFTYQGRLNVNGQPATGSYDMTFVLCDAANGLNLLATNTLAGVSVTGGLFTVTLDFGATAFDGAARWLEIGVRTNGSLAGFATLIPRQPLTPSPYALYATNAGSAAMATLAITAMVANGVAPNSITGAGIQNATLTASKIGNGQVVKTLNGLTDNVTLAAGVGLSLSDTTFNVIFGGTGSAGTVAHSDHNHDATYAPLVHIHSAADVASGTLSDARLPATVARLNVDQIFAGSNIFSGVVCLTNTANKFAGKFTGDGAGLTHLPTTVVDAERMRATVAEADLQTRLDTETVNRNVVEQTLASNLAGETTRATTAEATLASNLNTEIADRKAGDVAAVHYVEAELDAEIARATGAENSLWKLAGNSGTSPGANFLGTADFQPLELKVNGGRALRLEPTVSSPNVIGGYSGNVVSNGFLGATIGGGGDFGSANSVGAYYATVSGGLLNAASGYAGTIGGGYGNQVALDYATVSGGSQNTAGWGWTTVGGGQLNTASDGFATVSGGSRNTAGGAKSAVVGGSQNMAMAEYSTVGGGGGNVASGFASVVGGGGGFDAFGGKFGNLASGDSSVVGGGLYNTNEGYAGVIGGGLVNHVFGVGATIGGGVHNVCRDSGTVGGGYGNTNRGYGATIPGGAANYAGGDYSFAAGVQAKAIHDGAFVWADDSAGTDFASTGVNQFCIRAAGGVQLDGPSQTSLYFGTKVRQMINLWGTSYGIGVQAYTTYFRCDNSSGLNGFAWYRGGSHSDVPLDPGFGGFELMRLNSSGLLVSGRVCADNVSCTSDRNAKENFALLDSREVLGKLVALPLTTWSYKKEPGTRHIGPMAQDFYAAFHVGPDDKHITTVDADGVAIAAIQGLHELVQEKDAEISVLQKRLSELEQLNSDHETRLSRLEKTVIAEASSRPQAGRHEGNQR